MAGFDNDVVELVILEGIEIVTRVTKVVDKVSNHSFPGDGRAHDGRGCVRTDHTRTVHLLYVIFKFI